MKNNKNNKKKKVERVSAEGVLVALETIVSAALAQQNHKGKSKNDTNDSTAYITTSLKIHPSGIKVSNLPALAFSIIHPWVQTHTSAGVCDNSDAAHELEYDHMLQMVKGILEYRRSAVDEVDIDQDDEDDD